MRLTYILTFIGIIFSSHCDAQLTSMDIHQEWMSGFNMGFVNVDSPTMVFPEGKHLGTYVGFNVHISYYNFNPWGVHYYLDMKWVNDMWLQSAEFFRNEGLEARIELSGIVNHSIGINVFTNDRICLGLGGNFSDFIVDLPDWNSDGNFPNELIWQEPSGWYWTMGPMAFLDVNVGDLVATVSASKNFTYKHPKISNDYESQVSQIEGYEVPDFFYFDITINHYSGGFISFDHTSMLDNGINQQELKRNDVQLGWRFYL